MEWFHLSGGIVSRSVGPDHSAKGKLVCKCVSENDAALIAAAPDLLAACKAVVEHCALTHKHWGENCNRDEANAAVNALNSAIAKAEGDA